MKDEKENMPLVDTVAIVAEVYGAVCQLYQKIWNTTPAPKNLSSQSIYRHVLLYIVDTAGRHDFDSGGKV